MSDCAFCEQGVRPFYTLDADAASAVICHTCERYNDREPLATRKVSHSPKNPLYLKEISSERRKKRCIPWHFEMKFAPGS